MSRIQCYECGGADLLDPGTPLASLAPDLVAAMCRAHDAATHAMQRSDATYDAVAAAIAMLQAQHEPTP